MAYLSEFSDGRREQSQRGSSISRKWCLAITAGAALTGVAIGTLLPDIGVGKGDDVITKMKREAEVKSAFRNERYISLLQMRGELQERAKELRRRLDDTPNPGEAGNDASFERKLGDYMRVIADIQDYNAVVREFNKCLGDFPEFQQGKVQGETDKPAVPIEPLEEMMPLRVPTETEAGPIRPTKGRITI